MKHKSIISKYLVGLLSFTMVATSIGSVSVSDAASKPKLSAKKVTVKANKTKTVKVTGVKAKKIKKTTWTIKSKKTAALSAKTKTSVKVKGKKAGSTKLTASIKVGKKTYKINCTVKVVAEDVSTVTKTPVSTDATNSTTAPTATDSDLSQTAAPEPTAAVDENGLRVLVKATSVPITATKADDMTGIPAQATIDPAQVNFYSADFEDVAIGTTSKDVIGGTGISGVFLRSSWDGNSTDNDTLTVAADPDDANNKCLVVHREVKSWNGPVVDMVKAVPGAQYEISVKVKCADKVNISAQKKTTADADEGYDTLKSDTTVSKWTTLTEKFTAPDNFYSYGVYLQTSSGTSDIYVDDISIKLLKVSTPDKSIASLAETYKDVFDIWGVGAGMESLVGEDGLEFIKAQFNAYTPGNEFKPDAILGSSFESLDVDEAEKEGYVIPDAYKTDDANKKSGKVVVPKMDFTNVDSILKTASENNIKVRFHVLVWHQQTPIYFFKQTYKTAKTAANVSEETMNARLEMYIRTVMEHILNSNYADSIYGWDVVNEYLHSHGASDQNVNTNGVTFWEDIYNTANDSSVSGYKSQSGMSLTPSYVKLAFQIAKDELNKHNNTTKLFYNDYNTYDVAEDIVHLIDYINSDGKICDGIGMQSHLDQAYPSAQKFANTIAFFTANMPDEEIQITELDITKELVGGEPKTTDKEQAALYSDIMQAVLVNKKAGANISAFVLWSLYDGVSWRSAKEPCVFSGLFSAKAAFYAMIDAKAKYWN